MIAELRRPMVGFVVKDIVCEALPDMGDQKAAVIS
ncbi:hypothetical protein RSAG8_01564, partial [Rhizoctonia solani AG-8 WAC10335]